MTNKDEKYATKKYNNRSLMEAYNQLTQKDDTEFTEEYTENKDRDQYLSGGLMSTYAQMMDTYRTGTIDEQKQEPSEKE